MATDPAIESTDAPTAELGGAARLSSDHLTTSTRDVTELGRRIEAWLVTQLPNGATPVVSGVVKPEGNGMSSETVLFDAAWSDGSEKVARRCVARIEPELDKVPVFPTYDLAMQYRVMDLVGSATDVPVPEMLWFESDAEVIGAPFFVMSRIDGLVPKDVLPYTFGDNWVADATDGERAHLQRSAVEALAGIHTITPDTHDLSFLSDAGQADGTEGATALSRHLAGWERYLAWAISDGEPSPLLAECFSWLRANLPATNETRLSWGDARIGNMMFDGFDVVAVLDWEMAGCAPCEVDLGWMAYLHLFFQDITTDLGAPGIPNMMRPADVAAAYGEITGRTPGDLTWYLAYAAMRHGVIMRRVTERAVLFGEAERPEHVDDMIIHRETLRHMLAGTYWDTIGLS